MSERTFRRWQVRWRAEGAEELRDRRIGKPSSRRAAAAEIVAMLGLYRDHYEGFTVIGDAGRDEADDEERGGEGQGELAPRLVEAEQRTSDGRGGGEEQAQKAAGYKPLQRDLQQVGFKCMGSLPWSAPEVGGT